uniref:DUF2326 domain-containing protein n=1 Tax=Rhabditophanes sp. KR3021 TaxID=114890 RepID=A0AC35TPU6_9BILA
MARIKKANIRKNLEAARTELEKNCETKKSALRSVNERLTEENTALNNKVLDLENKLKEYGYKGSHKMLNLTRPRQAFDSLGARAASNRINFWIDTLQKLNGGEQLSQEACSSLMKRIMKTYGEVEKEKLAAAFFLSFIQKKPDSDFVPVKKDDSCGIVASAVKNLMTVRFQRFYDSIQLDYEEIDPLK